MTASDSLEVRTGDHHGIAGALEARARHIAQESMAMDETEAVENGIRREIALVIEQIDRLRAVHDQLVSSLLKIECYVDTELLQMEQRTPPYSPYRYPEREKLQRRLLEIDRERRDRRVVYEQRIAELHQRLLHLLNEHAVLAPDAWTSNASRRSSRR